jgi:hypothetical protein
MQPGTGSQQMHPHEPVAAYGAVCAGEGWLAAAGLLGPGDRGQGGANPAADSAPGALSFSLACEVEELAPVTSATAGTAGEGAGGGGAAAREDEAQDAAAVVRHVLGGHPGGTALVPSLYRPVLQVGWEGGLWVLHAYNSVDGRRYLVSRW